MADQSTETQPVQHSEHKHDEQPSSPGAKLALRRKLAAVSTVAGIIVGYLSYMINVPVYSLVLMIIVAIVFTVIVKKAFKPVAAGGKRWWSTPIAVYVLVWLVVWTIFFNMYIVKP